MKKLSYQYIVIGLTIAVISFFAGMQYKVYQIKSSLGTVFSGISEFNAYSDSDEKIGEKNTQGKQYKRISNGEFTPLEGDGGEGGQFNVRVTQSNWVGNKIEDGFLSYTSDNEFLAITFESENIGKTPNFKAISTGKLITKEGVEYTSFKTTQKHDFKDGYGGCISCESNPGDKNVEDLVFDIKKVDLEGAFIRFSDEGVELEL